MARFPFTNLIFNVLDPFQIGRNYFIFPAWSMVQKYYNDTKMKTKNGVLSVRDIILRVIIVMLAFAVVLWTSVFMYIAFYYTYMPVTSHSRPAHMQFSACENGNGLCTFPQAYVALTRKQQLLMVGQPYRVLVVIDMPESPVNQNLGMFLVCAEMRGQKSNLKAHSCRAALLTYKSTLLNWISTWIKAPLFILGLREEKQSVVVELFTHFQDTDDFPVTDIYVEIQSKQIQFYSVSLEITAHFTGLRYFMFHWPLLSASIGICTNLFFIIIVSLLSWLHWNAEHDWLDEAKEKLKNMKWPRIKRPDTNTVASQSYIEEVEDFEEDDESEIQEIQEIQNASEKTPQGVHKRKIAQTK